MYAVMLKELFGKIDIDFHLYYYAAGYLRYVNNSVNFFVYCLSGNNFRSEFKNIFHRTEFSISFNGQRQRGQPRFQSSGTILSFIAAAQGKINATG